MNYEKTLWRDNITIVDAEKLNKIEDNLFDLSVSSINLLKAVDIIEDRLDMKSNNGHIHLENATITDLELLREENRLLESKIDEIKKDVDIQVKNAIDNAEIDDNNILHLYSQGKLLKSIKHKETPVIKVSISTPTDLTKIWIDTKS